MLQIRRACSWCAAFLTFVVVDAGLAQNWPSFRGPNGSGVGNGDPPVKWDVESGKNVKWKTAVPGLAHSSPIIWGDRIFLTTAVCADNSEPDAKTGWLNGTGDSAPDSGEWIWMVLCLDRQDGRILWQKDAHKGEPRAARHLKATHANSTPATDGKHVVAFFGSEGLYCYDTSGKLLWKKDLGVFKCGPHKTDLEWGFASSPIIHDGQVIVQCDALNTAFWAAFDLKTGTERKRIKRKEITTTWCTPTVIESAGHAQLVCNGYKEMSGYDLSSGERLWTLRDGGDCPVPRPLVADGLIYLTNGHGRSPVFAIRADAKGDLTPDSEATPKGMAWWSPRGGSYMPTPLVMDGRLYVASDNGIMNVFDARNGKEIYRERIPGGGTFSASVVAVKDRLYFVNEDGVVFVMKAGDSFSLLEKNAMNEVCMATPAISDGQLFIRGRGNLYCVGK